MTDRRLPVRPDLDQLKHQAKDLLRAIHAGDPAALAELRQLHPNPPEPARARLADAQLTLARAYQAPSWPRLAQACRLIDAIWEDDVDTVREMVTANPHLLHEHAVIRDSNWGFPLSYAANIGRDRIIAMLHELGATDLHHALDRAILQSRVATARMLHKMMGSPRPSADLLGGAAYTLSDTGTALLFELGVEMETRNGKPFAPVSVVLESDSRKREAKHHILEMYASHGVELPDTPPMAVHRGRIDLLEHHLRRDPAMLSRTFSYQEMFPPELDCEHEKLPRTTLAGATLLHLAIEFEEMEIVQWLLDRGMDVDTPATVDGQGFGGHTALFATVVSYPNFWMNYTKGWASSIKPREAPFARLLLDRGANANARASLREHDYDGKLVAEHRDVTPLAWGGRFQNRLIVSEPAMELIASRGGHA